MCPDAGKYSENNRGWQSGTLEFYSLNKAISLTSALKVPWGPLGLLFTIFFSRTLESKLFFFPWWFYHELLLLHMCWLLFLWTNHLFPPPLGGWGTLGVLTEIPLTWGKNLTNNTITTIRQLMKVNRMRTDW